MKKTNITQANIKI